jgi:hypothetical protein
MWPIYVNLRIFRKIEQRRQKGIVQRQSAAESLELGESIEQSSHLVVDVLHQLLDLSFRVQQLNRLVDKKKT